MQILALKREQQRETVLTRKEQNYLIGLSWLDLYGLSFVKCHRKCLHYLISFCFVVFLFLYLCIQIATTTIGIDCEFYWDVLVILYVVVYCPELCVCFVVISAVPFSL